MYVQAREPLLIPDKQLQLSSEHKLHPGDLFFAESLVACLM